MIVRRSELGSVLAKLAGYSHLALDTETTGLRIWRGDRLFSIIIATDETAYYFNFQKYAGVPEEWILLRPGLQDREFRTLLEAPERTWFLHNAKFDLATLHQENLSIGGAIHCTQALARVEYNDHFSYDLDACAKRIGLAKDDAVKKYIDDNKLWEWGLAPGKKQREKRMFFDRVPLEVVVPYGCRDADVTYKLGKHQEGEFQTLAASTPQGLPTILNVVENEKTFTKTCFEFEKTGIKIDRAYCQAAARYEESRYGDAAREFEKLTGLAFVDSGKTLAQAFRRMGESFPTTEKGNPSFTDDVLAHVKSPVAGIVREYRDAYKKANTYYRSYLHFADGDDAIHATIRQGGTNTGRVSYANPNLQNIPKEEDLTVKYLVRRAFVPRPGYCFVMMDYDTMEFSMMCDYAGQMDIIEKIKQGFDPHQSTADLVGIERRPAKILNFGILYGMGLDLLGEKLVVPPEQARLWRDKYFSALPDVKRLIDKCSRAAKYRGYIFNWAGRRYHFSDPNFAYKATNHLIQGGCADVIKFAMNRLYHFLRGRMSRMLVQIHDELLFEIHESELHIVPELQNIMQSVYPYRHLPLTVGIDHSWRSFADKQEGLPAARQSA